MIRAGGGEASVILHQFFFGLQLREVAVPRELDGKSRVSQKSLGQEPAVTKDGHQVGQRRRNARQVCSHVRRRLLRVALQKVQCAVRIGRLRQQRGQRGHQRRSQLLLQAGQIGFRLHGIKESYGCKRRTHRLGL